MPREDLTTIGPRVSTCAENRSIAVGLLMAALLLAGCTRSMEVTPTSIRVMTYNIEDVRTSDLLDAGHPRLKRIAAVIQRIRPDILLLNEIAYDEAGAPGYSDGPPGQNARRFIQNFLAHSQGPDLEPIDYVAFMAPSNTGIASGFDLDNDGAVVHEIPVVPESGADGSPGPQTAEGRAYGNDSWGFGMFPGQYGMALLVRKPLEIRTDLARTFRLLPWHTLPEALRPTHPETGESWFSEEEWATFRLSSKSHWDIPVALPNGKLLHLLCSHPTPPSFDGDEERNKKRNHDEIRFWADYLDNSPYVVDDDGTPGGLPEDETFVIAGDLNADPDEGSAIGNPIGSILLAHPRVQADIVPVAELAIEGLDADDTARWGLRVDYLVPAKGLHVLRATIDRSENVSSPLSDHFPVWMDLSLTEDPGR